MSSISGFKVGIVRLGKIARKTKYSLLDEKCLQLVEQYAFEAKLELDANGDGAKILAWIYDIDTGRSSGQYLHELLWELHCGGIAPGWKVVHLNGITLDNRLDNLTLIPSLKSFKIQEELNQKVNKEQSLYWAAIQQLPEESVQDPIVTDTISPQFSDNENVEHNLNTGQELAIYECQYAPCTNMEKHIREFSICGRCRQVRYCGLDCQQWHWNAHKKVCKERKRFIIRDIILDR